MEAIKAKARIGPNQEIIWLEPLPELVPGEVEVILLYTRNEYPKPNVGLWPVLEGGRYLGGSLRREDIYDDAR